MAVAELALLDRRAVHGHLLQPVPVGAALVVEAGPRPGRRVPVDRAGAGQRDVRLVPGVDEGRVVVALDPLPAGVDVRQVRARVATAGIDTVAELRAQIEAGELRVLAVDSEQRMAGVDAPTMKELGLGDEAISTLAGVLAPAGLTKEQQQEVIGLLDKVRQTSCWKKVLERNNWTEDWRPGDQFGQVLAEQRTQVTTILGELGLGK
ncbi:tripartite tricarboxylate transporter substrate-binding protein [Nonomuraea sp. NPDC049784]|uniref:tripartite tricarboxylate transporter substrate-binding protein n=1 Tax=Nonomuraea sp. NPDC049784 TaxID=3154361 RepID=UPI0033DCC977